ncbi:peptidase S24 [Leptospira sp. 201903070]|uniref:Peptidase S24 n=1 Tax=Leptospira ainlahdjerensis TaxID=2810033 RepID=A0ABS2UET9_9LEPT|nr:S24 family peptidase [Leptospira ainlahdjerensis]MBM9578887.1 peptidase S24 [Leptospira ainlahdjerensis]
MLLLENLKLNRTIPLLRTPLHAGFPSPADDYLRKKLDPRDILELNPLSTFYMLIAGHSWEEFNIHDRDIVVIDRSIPPSSGKLAIVTHEGSFALRMLGKIDGQLCFLTQDSTGMILSIEPSSEFQIWGIITFVIHRY